MDLKVVIEKGEDGKLVARAPALRGCWSQGATRDEAVANIREAIALWLETEQDKADATNPAADIDLVHV